MSNAAKSGDPGVSEAATKWKFERSGDGNRHIRTADGKSIMCDEEYYPWCPEEDSHWHLIAAAPDLLDALLGMLELERHTHRLPDTVNVEWMYGIIRDAKDAIEKAVQK